MTIEVTIPEGIVNTCKECGYDENKTKKVATYRILPPA